MAKKLYYPTLNFLVNRICNFITRYYVPLYEIVEGEFGAPGVAALEALEAGCHAWRDTIEITVNP